MEMLMVVLLLSLLSAGIMTMVGTGFSVYGRITADTQAEMFADLLEETVSGLLHGVRDMTTQADGMAVFTETDGTSFQFFIGDAEGEASAAAGYLHIKRTETNETQAVLGASAYPPDILLSAWDVHLENGIFSVSYELEQEGTVILSHTFSVYARNLTMG